MAPYWRTIRTHWRVVTSIILVGLAAREIALQQQDAALIRGLTDEVVRATGAVTPRQKAVAIRDHLRRTVTYLGAPVQDRAYLRATACETLIQRKGVLWRGQSGLHLHGPNPGD